MYRTLVLLGVTDLSSIRDASKSLFGISESKIHPGYKKPAAYHDLAIAKLNRSIPHSFSVVRMILKVNSISEISNLFNIIQIKVSPICLPEVPNPDSDRMSSFTVTLSGWGKSFALQDGAASKLKSVQLSIFPQTYAAYVKSG